MAGYSGPFPSRSAGPEPHPGTGRRAAAGPAGLVRGDGPHRWTTPGRPAANLCSHFPGTTLVKAEHARMSKINTAGADASPPAGGRGPLDRLFDLTARRTTVARELRGGVTTFFAMAYIILLNPIILGGAKDVTGATLSIPQLTTMTALSAAITTVIMGLVGNAPLALAAGLGINAVVAFQAAPVMTWPQAMGLVVIEGVIIVLLALTGVRERIMNSIPL